MEGCSGSFKEDVYWTHSRLAAKGCGNARHWFGSIVSVPVPAERPLTDRAADKVTVLHVARAIIVTEPACLKITRNGQANDAHVFVLIFHNRVVRVAFCAIRRDLRFEIVIGRRDELIDGINDLVLRKFMTAVFAFKVAASICSAGVDNPLAASISRRCCRRVNACRRRICSSSIHRRYSSRCSAESGCRLPTKPVRRHSLKYSICSAISFRSDGIVGDCSTSGP